MADSEERFEIHRGLKGVYLDRSAATLRSRARIETMGQEP